MDTTYAGHEMLLLMQQKIVNFIIDVKFGIFLSWC
uniref:Uncharacterized protein n=1 Tax=Rhizophora mucronata TaxID=61149 RepID=A0A2P2N1E1_RHIMU